jgi:hypothetical protein
MEDWTDPLSIAIMPSLSMTKMQKWKSSQPDETQSADSRVREASGTIVIGAPHSYGGGTRQLAQRGNVDAVKWLA